MNEHGERAIISFRRIKLSLLLTTPSSESNKTNSLADIHKIPASTVLQSTLHYASRLLEMVVRGAP